MCTEVLNVNDAKKILYELLQELGWEEGDQTFQQSNMTMTMQMSMANATMIDSSQNPAAARNMHQHAAPADQLF